MASRKVPQILKEIQNIHDRKNADYAQESNPWSNFERAAVIASWINNPLDKVFATLIGIKLARMAELLNGKKPNNESLADSFLDMNTYGVLWHANYLERTKHVNLEDYFVSFTPNELFHHFRR